MKNKIITCLLFIFLFPLKSSAQCPGSLTHDWDIPMTFPNQTLTCLHDLNKNYLYVAGKEQGLLIYDLSTINSPVLALAIPNDLLLNLDVNSLTQDGNYLYLALGNIFDESEHSAMAIIDISIPASAYVTDTWEFNGFSGAGIVKVQGDFAYLGAMQNGLIILDVANKYNIQFVSQYIPDLSFPSANPDTLKYNARGMEIIGDILYLCFDAGGLRIINIHDKQNPVETGRYCLPFLNTHPRAYNNIVMDDSLAYITIDYCGLEILNVGDTSNITQVGWWNPWDCATASNWWLNSRGHTNELRYVKDCKLIFISTGKSQINVVDVSNPSAPDSCTMYGTQADLQGTWGLDVYQDKIFACYIFVPLGIPFQSNWAGVKMISWNNACEDYVEDVDQYSSISVFPNPTIGNVFIRDFIPSKIIILNTIGQSILVEDKDDVISFENFSAGIYFIRLFDDQGIPFQTVKIIRE